MNVGIGTVAAQFLSWEYVFQIFAVVCLQCIYSIQQSEEDISPHVSPPNDGYFCPWQDTVIMIHRGFPYECHRQKMYEHVHYMCSYKYSMLLVLASN